MSSLPQPARVALHPLFDGFMTIKTIVNPVNGDFYRR
jgi:hypothetical protein